MRALKILVVAMGVLLVAGTVALVIAVAHRIGRPEPAPRAEASVAHTIQLPAGARVVTSETSGDRLVVQAALANGDAELFIFDLSTGAEVAAITLHAKPVAP